MLAERLFGQIRTFFVGHESTVEPTLDLRQTWVEWVLGRGELSDDTPPILERDARRVRIAQVERLGEGGSP